RSEVPALGLRARGGDVREVGEGFVIDLETDRFRRDVLQRRLADPRRLERCSIAAVDPLEGGDALGLRLAGAVDDPVGDLARLLALAAFLGALGAGLLGRGLRLGRLGSRCRGDWILRFGMERGAVLVVAAVAAPAERESSGDQQCCADGRDRRLRHQTSPLSASGVPVVVFTWTPDFVFIFETRFMNSCGATMKDAMSAEAAPAIQMLLKMPSATESPQRKIM